MNNFLLAVYVYYKYFSTYYLAGAKRIALLSCSMVYLLVTVTISKKEKHILIHTTITLPTTISEITVRNHKYTLRGSAFVVFAMTLYWMKKVYPMLRRRRNRIIKKKRRLKSIDIGNSVRASIGKMYHVRTALRSSKQNIGMIVATS